MTDIPHEVWKRNEQDETAHSLWLVRECMRRGDEIERLERLIKKLTGGK